ncbi:MAG TPA: zinc-ribbon domain-containing protein [Tepidisphaeraceae bacterium]|nr:zinc-ribbon domain-containing protein [Tepidisphaeraceae bacterium]
MMRRLLIIMAVCSALLCVAATAAWIISLRYSAWVSVPVTKNHDAGMAIDRGTVALLCNSDPHLFTSPGGWEWSYRRAGGKRLIDFVAPRGRMGFGAEWEPYEKAICLPLWFFAVAGLLGAATLARLAVRKRRPRCCSKCGYDLRASEHRCPECGTPIPRKEAVKR